MLSVCLHPHESPDICPCSATCSCRYSKGKCAKRFTAKPDPINKPSHYQASNGIETWDVINGFGLGYERGNAVKYLTRAGKKEGVSPLSDLYKAQKYIERAIARVRAGVDINDV